MQVLFYERDVVRVFSNVQTHQIHNKIMMCPYCKPISYTYERHILAEYNINGNKTFAESYLY